MDKYERTMMETLFFTEDEKPKANYMQLVIYVTALYGAGMLLSQLIDTGRILGWLN